MITIALNMQKNEHIIVTDDLNFDMLQNNNAEKRILVFMQNHNLTLHTTKATRNIISMLDHFLTILTKDNIYIAFLMIIGLTIMLFVFQYISKPSQACLHINIFISSSNLIGTIYSFVPTLYQ
jgi:hypothetical protein